MQDNTPVKPRFKGAFHQFEALIFEDREKGLKEVFLVFSSGKREATLKYLWHKLVWDELTKDEFALFLLTLKDEDDKKWAFLKALLSKSKKSLRKRLNLVETLVGDQTTSQLSYQGLKGMRIEIHKRTRKLPKVPKYSGYVRSIASLGKGNPRSSSFLEAIVDTPYEDEVRIDWYSMLSVENLPFFQGEVAFSRRVPEKDETETR